MVIPYTYALHLLEGCPTPFFPKTHRNLDLGMGKKYMKRGKQTFYFQNRKNSHFSMMRRNLDLGMGKKYMEREGKSIRFNKLLYIIMIVFCILNKIFRVS